MPPMSRTAAASRSHGFHNPFALVLPSVGVSGSLHDGAPAPSWLFVFRLVFGRKINMLIFLLVHSAISIPLHFVPLHLDLVRSHYGT